MSPMHDRTVCLSATQLRAEGVIFSRVAVSGPALLLSLGLVAGLTGCKQKAAEQQGMPPQPVEVVTIHPHPIHTQTVLPGRTDAYEQAQIRPQVSGMILTRSFKQGSDMHEGDLLYKINPAPYQATYDRAKAALLQAQAAAVSIEAQLRRYRPLATAHAVSSQDYDNTLSQARQAEAQIAQAKANVASAKVNLDWTEVRSPIDGRIGRMLVTPGSLVTAGQTAPIAVVTRLDPIYVDVNLADVDMLRLRREMAQGQIKGNGKGMPPVTLELDDGSTYPRTGELRLAEVTVDPATGTLVLRAEFPNPDKLLLPGMFVHARIDEGEIPDALTVPQVALQRDSKGNPQVLVVGQDSKVAIRPVRVGRIVDQSWQVLDGLKDGDRVIVNGLQKVRPGAKVKVTEAADAPQSKAD
ncbi:multidrug resistance efflux pump acriflavin resistance protein [Acidomonas methanolica NBRC 104435]|uniref:Multidrug resistance efflux pump acriflavin resistance protein n=2 Tax=Acidomonas methanolica TaxID=437 RepID=A0A023D889_ACIMT|nr:efflux RND transporter periplasmic adaptor subunit [Acidomonas methanolica]TCS21160.1 membrane fusion protein (multidrug efflux system) [Acidomonas methanolica]GAJ30387.1 multidrug resistance efflux pump acriflavin resistance protein [Acidomonas methanolica NBRC 104435]GEL00494.1 MexE family multidrug efflux RND transporter periplasmic adaptor subunit [Acidomonas methanolica NBRC 104435]